MEKPWTCCKCGKKGSGALNEKQHIDDCMLGEIIAEFTRQLTKRDKQIADLKNRKKERK